MIENATTGEMKFGSDKIGLFIAHEDLKLYSSSILALIRGRNDAMSIATTSQLLSLMLEAADDDLGVSVAVCKDFNDCKVTSAQIDRIMKT